MPTLKLTSWNVEYLDRLIAPNLNNHQTRRRDAIAEEIQDLDPDILCIVEGPNSEAKIDDVCTTLLNGDYTAVHAPDGEYGQRGTQWIWFLVKTPLIGHSSLLPVATWDAWAGKTWEVYFWGEKDSKNHRHYRHPQVLVFEEDGFRMEFIGLHLKSKFVNRGESSWNAGGQKKQDFIEEAIKARIKMTTEALNVRTYIERKFEQVENPAIFVLGDFNDGPGRDYFEKRYMFLDLVSNLQGDVFFARRFLNHALFDYSQDLRWSVYFEDFTDAERDPHILLDHILFTQGLVDGSLPATVNEGAGMVEHEIHDLVNATLPLAAKTSDHKPVSCLIDLD